MAVINLADENPYEARFWAKDLIFLTLIFTFLYFGQIFVRDFAHFPDLFRFAEIPRQMVASGDWLTPYFTQINHYADLPLFYWMQAIAIKLFGHNIVALKFWSAFFGVLGVISVYPITRIFFGRRCAVIASSIMGTNALYFTYALVVSPYMVASMLLSLTFLAYLYHTQFEGKAGKFFAVLFWILLALSNLAMGFSAILLPVLAIILYTTCLKAMNFLPRLLSPTGIIIFLVITIGWLFIGYQHDSNFISAYFIHTNAFNLLAELDESISRRLLILPVLFIACLPWAIFLVNALWFNWFSSWKERYEHQHMFFFMFWLGLVLIELAFSAGKMPWLLTISIPVNVMIARYLGMLWDRKKVVSTKRSVDVLFYVFIVAILTILGVLYFNWFKYPAISIPYLQLMLIVLLAVAVVTIPIMRYRSFSAGFYTLFCASLACLVTLNYCAPYLGEHKVEPLKQRIQHELNKQGLVKQ